MVWEGPKDIEYDIAGFTGLNSESVDWGITTGITFVIEKHFITENVEVAVNQEVKKLRAREVQFPSLPTSFRLFPYSVFFAPSVVNYYGKN